MRERKENRSARRSRKMIRQAFEALLKEKGFHKITVTDLVARADLNRSTFYAHYPDIYGIVDEMQVEILQWNMELIQRLGLTENIRRKSEQLQEMMEYDIMHNSDITETVRKSALFGIRVHFFLGGIINIYQLRSEGKLNCTLDQVSSQIGNLICQSATGFPETDRMQKLSRPDPYRIGPFICTQYFVQY